MYGAGQGQCEEGKKLNLSMESAEGEEGVANSSSVYRGLGVLATSIRQEVVARLTVA